jgi:hypothetical protein
MKKQFQNLEIQCWLGPRLGVAEPCFCLQAGPAECSIILAALDELATEGVSARRALTLKTCNRKIKCTTIRLVFSPESEDLRQMSFSRVNDIATFEFTPVGLLSFREAVVLWRDGGEDFGVSPDRNKSRGRKDLGSGEVWFWTRFMDP